MYDPANFTAPVRPKRYAEGHVVIDMSGPTMIVADGKLVPYVRERRGKAVANG